MAGDLVPLREHIEALFQQTATAMLVAEQEREKAANALRIGLERAIKEGDERLREHIQNQVQQIHGSLISSEKLEKQRIAAVMERIASVQREVQISNEAQAVAIKKAEAATDRRLEGMNEFRNTLADQSRTQMPRELADSQFNELRHQIQRLQDAFNKAMGQERGKEVASGQTTKIISNVIAFVSTAAFVIYVMTQHH